MKTEENYTKNGRKGLRNSSFLVINSKIIREGFEMHNLCPWISLNFKNENEKVSTVDCLIKVVCNVES